MYRLPSFRYSSSAADSIRLVILLFALILTHSLTAAGTAHNIQSISSRDGLSNNAILTMNQDSRGYIWIGTCDGLNRWDGNEMRIYPYDWEGTEDLSGRFIGSIIKTDDGLFVINNNHGVDIFDPIRLTVRKHPEITARKKMDASDINHVFIAEQDSILAYSPELDRFLSVPAPEGYEFRNILGISVHDDLLYVFDTDQGIVIYATSVDGDELKINLVDIIKPGGPRFAKTFNDGSNTLVFHVDGTLYEYEGGDLNPSYIFNLGDEIPRRGWPSSIVRAGNDIIVSYPTTGALRLRHEPLVPGHYVKEELDISCGVFTALNDSRQDIVWFGTDGKGLLKMYKSPYALKNFRTDNLKESIWMPVRSIFHKDGHLWFGTKGDGLFDITLEGKPFGKDLNIRRFTTTSSGLSENSVYAISESSRPLIWIGNNSNKINYYSFKDKRIHSIPTDGVLNQVHGIYEYSPDSLWISTTGAGVFLAIVDGGDYPYFRDIQKIQLGDEFEDSPMFFAMYPQNDSIIWFGHKGNGIVSYNVHSGDSRIIDLSTLGKLTYNDVYAITSDNEGIIWAGTGEGVIRIGDGGIELVKGTRGAIHAIANDGIGNIWASGNRGLFRIGSSGEIVENYWYDDGLETVEFSDGAMYVDDDGSIWFGGIDGIVKITANCFEPREHHPQIEFREMEINGKIIPVCNLEKNGTIILRHGQNLTNLKFGAIDYINGKDYIFKWRINELHTEWRESSGSIPFTRLKHGTYTVDARYKDNASGYESGISHLTIKIRAPWYSSLAAKIFYIFLLIGIISLIVRHFVLKHRASKARRHEAMMEDFRKKQQDSMMKVISDIADEFAVPITLIYGNCRMIMEKDRMKKHFPAEINSIFKNTVRLKNLSCILDGIGSKGDSAIELQDVSSLTEAIVSPFRHEAEKKGCTLSVDLAPSIVWAIDKKSWSIATNLIAEFLMRNTLPSGRLSMSLKASEEHLDLVMSSDRFGIGMDIIDGALKMDAMGDWPEEMQDRMYINRFSLPILNEILGKFNAMVHAESPAEGAVMFSISVARNSVPENGGQIRAAEVIEEQFRFPQSEAPVRQKIFDTNRKTILMLDNGDSVCRFIINALSDEYNVLSPDTLEMAVETLDQDHPDLIICGNGDNQSLSLLDQVKHNSATSHIPAILIVFKKRVDSSGDGLELADACIQIPFEIDTLRTTITQLISRNNVLKAYYLSPMSNFKMSEGKLLHNEDKEFVDRIYNIIYSNISNPDLSPQFIADEMGLSLRNLYRRTEPLMDTRISALIKNYRLSVAANLLVSEKLPVDEVIFRTGFVNRGTFFRLFSEKYGMTPKKYMMNPRNDGEQPAPGTEE
ncbi:MAG: two-component regulator propeller domain-containing protein [Candidatus Cryptobacteroides sp.]